jgi:hypothetical protein
MSVQKALISTILGAILTVSLSAPLAAKAAPYEAYVGIVPSGRNIAGVQGVLTPLLVYSTPSGFYHHKDFMNYIYFIDSLHGDRTMGAGWYSDTFNTNYDMVYRYESAIGPNHDLTTSIGTTQFTATVKQNSQGGSCWTGITSWQTDSYCFVQPTTVGGAAGYIGRTFDQYSAGNNDLPSDAKHLHYGYWNNSQVTFDNSSYFSYNTGEVKCWSNTAAGSSNTYVVNGIAKESSDMYGQTVDEVETGPRLIYSDNCKSISTQGTASTAWEAVGESTGAGSNP